MFSHLLAFLLDPIQTEFTLTDEEEKEEALEEAQITMMLQFCYH